MGRTGRLTLRLHHQEMVIRFETWDLAAGMAARTINGTLDEYGQWYRPRRTGRERVEAIQINTRGVIAMQGFVE